MKRLCVFCGSSPGVRPIYTEVAEALGEMLAKQGIQLVYGGGSRGLMGKLADSALRHGGHVIGVIPQALEIKEVVHAGLSDLRVVADMHERKALMAKLADGFIALPGGFGTCEEFCEVLTWSQLGFHRKPFGLLDSAGFYRALLQFFDHATTEGFIRPVHRQLLLVAEDPATLLARMTNWQPEGGAKCLD